MNWSAADVAAEVRLAARNLIGRQRHHDSRGVGPLGLAAFGLASNVLERPVLASVKRKLRSPSFDELCVFTRGTQTRVILGAV